MKKYIACLLIAILAALTFASCGSHTCNFCNKSCSGAHSYKDGEVYICNSCYKNCFKGNLVNIDPADILESAEG
ncbi:MAG: hypothetical protein IKX77_01260 [Clostridia bacterium]|nr:hypothetical protein [Clostridia bacterium]